MFKESNKFEKFESKVWLSSPTMHGPEIEYVKEAYETNWMSTVGKNINEVERMACEYIGCKYAVALSAGTASLHLAFDVKIIFMTVAYVFKRSDVNVDSVDEGRLDEIRKAKVEKKRM